MIASNKDMLTKDQVMEIRCDLCDVMARKIYTDTNENVYLCEDCLDECDDKTAVYVNDMMEWHIVEVLTTILL